MKYTLKKIYIKETNKEGVPYKDKNGKPYTRVAIQLEETGDTWHSNNFVADKAREWQPGDQLELILEQNGEWNNFKLPTKTDNLEVRMASVETRLAALEARAGFGPGSINTEEAMREEITKEDIAPVDEPDEPPF